jgi:alcohol dehydrogenase (NADP+)
MTDPPHDPGVTRTTVGVVGCGAVAPEYVAGIDAEPTLELVGAADPGTERARAVLADHAPGTDAAVFEHHEALLADAGPDLVVNLTPHAAHAPVSRACLAAGADVYSEKPLALDPDDARDLLATAAEHGVRLGCAPASHLGPTARRAGRLLDEDRLGAVRLATAHCNVGRVTEWHDDPESFLRAGPLSDAGVYPLTVLTALFGPVRRVEAAHASRLLAGRAVGGRTLPRTPDHVVATLAFDGGVRAQLTASMYVPYRAREFVSLELHGDDGSLYLADAGGLEAGDRGRLRLAPLGRDYVPVPLERDAAALGPADGVAELAAAAREGRPSAVDAGRAAHVVETVAAVEAAAADRRPVPVPTPRGGPRAAGRHAVDDGGDGGTTSAGGRPLGGAPATWEPATAPVADAPALPPVGFGCSRYRGGETYVDLADALGRALDAGCRLFDTAELYGTESTIRDALARRGRPGADAVTLVSKVWNTNHAPGDLRRACEASLDRLGVDRLDYYLLHWPDAWEHRGPLGDASRLGHEELQARAFPTDDDGEPREAAVDLATTWRAMEALVDDGLVERIGVCNVDRDALASLSETARRPPALVQVERHPYRPREALVDRCHGRGTRVVAHSPLSAPGLLDEPVLAEVADAHGVTPAQVVLRWNVERGVVPVPSSTDPDHVVDNLDLFGFSLSDRERERVDALRDPECSR